VRRVILAAAFLLLFLPLTVPLLTFRVFSIGDMIGFHVPMRYVYREALRAGDTFLWTSQFSAGIYLHGEGQEGMAHPLHLVAYRFLPLTVAMNLEMLATYVLATSGLWLLLRRLGLHSTAAFGGALTFAFGGFMLPHLNHLNMIVVAAHIPWIVLAADLLLSGTAVAAGFAGVALVLGSQVLLGYPQIVWMTALIVAWFTVFRLTTGAPIARVALLACALAAGLLIGGIQLLPTLDAVRDSVRVVFNAAFTQTAYSLHPLNLIQLVSPYALKDGIYAAEGTVERTEWWPHEFGLYAGALATMSVVWTVLRWRALRDRRLAAACLCLAAIGLALALGRYGGVYPLVAQLPMLRVFRAPSRHVLIVHFALAGLVGLTLDDLLRRRAEDPPVRIWPLLLMVGLSADATAGALGGLHWAGIAGVRVWDHPHAIAGLGFAAITAGLLAMAARGWRLAVPLLILVFAADLGLWGLAYPYETPPVKIGPIVTPEFLPRDVHPGDLVHLDFAMNWPVMRKVRTHTSYIGLVRASVLDPEQIVTQRLAGVMWTRDRGEWEPLRDTMPRARLVSEWRESHEMATDVTRIDIAQTALVGESPGKSDAPAGAAHVIEDRPGRMRVETRAAAAQLLVLTERYHRGWTARVDGVDTPVRPVYGDFLGCVVPAGARTVSFVFDPASARAGLWATFAGLAFMAAGAWASSRARQRIPYP
jgi:hypothetical protein